MNKDDLRYLYLEKKTTWVKEVKEHWPWRYGIPLSILFSLYQEYNLNI